VLLLRPARLLAGLLVVLGALWLPAAAWAAAPAQAAPSHRVLAGGALLPRCADLNGDGYDDVTGAYVGGLPCDGPPAGVTLDPPSSAPPPGGAGSGGFSSSGGLSGSSGFLTAVHGHESTGSRVVALVVLGGGLLGYALGSRRRRSRA